MSRGTSAEQLEARFGDFMDELEGAVKQRLALSGRGLSSSPATFEHNLETCPSDESLRDFLFKLAPIDDSKLVFLGFWKLIFDCGINDADAIAIADRVLATISLRVACRESLRYWMTSRSP